MDMGKSFAWLLFLAVVAGAGSLGHHRDNESPRPAPGAAVQLAVQAPAPLAAPAMTSTVALDTTHVMATRTGVRAVK
jgi:hypothetical protein